MLGPPARRQAARAREKKHMRRSASLILLIGAALSSSTALAGANPALCLAIEKNYNECVRRARAKEAERREGRRHEPKSDACAVWVYELKANGLLLIRFAPQSAITSTFAPGSAAAISATWR
jgi:hypothetical protein